MEPKIDVRALLKALGELQVMTPNEPPSRVGEKKPKRIGEELKNTDWTPERFRKLYAAEPRVAAGVLAVILGFVETIPLGRSDEFKESPEQRDARESIFQHSADADLSLAIYDPLRALRFEVAPWSEAGGLPGGTVSFDVRRGGHLQSLSVPLSPILAADYNQARARVSGERTDDNCEKLRIFCEADDAYVMFALALSLHEHPDEKPATKRLFEAAAHIAALFVHRLKHEIGAPRPVLSGGDTVVETPRYSSYPGGHAFACAILSTVLAELTQAKRASRDALDLLAHGIGVRRELAGLHCTYDTDDGLSLGRVVGRWLVLAAQEPQAFPGWSALYVSAAMEWNAPPAGSGKPSRKRAATQATKGH